MGQKDNRQRVNNNFALELQFWYSWVEYHLDNDPRGLKLAELAEMHRRIGNELFGEEDRADNPLIVH